MLNRVNITDCRLSDVLLCGSEKVEDTPVIVLETNTIKANFSIPHISPVTVDWGDGNKEEVIVDNIAHVYEKQEVRNVCIYAKYNAITKFIAGYGNGIVSLNVEKVKDIEQIIVGNNFLQYLDVSQNNNLNRVEINGCGLVNNDANLMLLARSLPDRTGKSLGTLRLINAAQAEKIKDILTPKNWVAG